MKKFLLLKVIVKRSVFLILYTLPLTLYTLNSAQIIPVGNVSLGGSSSYFESENQTNGLDFNFVFVPAIKLSEKTSILPGIYLNYSGAKSVQELLGGGTLYQDELGANINFRYIRKLSEYSKLKFKTGYKIDYLRETKDESLGDGLFDYNKLTFGVENELKNFLGFDKFQVSVDYFGVKFPNYVTLAESSYGKEVSTEASPSPGGNILDFGAVSIFNRGLKYLTLDSVLNYTFIYTYKDFSEQRIVKADGSFSNDTRTDNKIDLSVLYSKYQDNLKFSWGIKTNLSFNLSSQDHYDAERYEYTENYYDYTEYMIGPVFSKKFSSLKTDLSITIGSKLYKDRKVQDENGSYKTEKIKNVYTAISLKGVYPLMEKLKVFLEYNLLNQSSNMKYEQTYKYNFTTFNFVLGLNYEF